MSRRRIIRIIFSLLILALVSALGIGVNQNGKLAFPNQVEKIEPGYYPVILVEDGDTIKVRVSGKAETVRFIGIDTPEVKDPRKPVQCFGRAASAKTHELLDGKSVRLEGDPQNSDRDKYHRLLR